MTLLELLVGSFDIRFNTVATNSIFGHSQLKMHECDYVTEQNVKLSAICWEYLLVFVNDS